MNQLKRTTILVFLILTVFIYTAYKLRLNDLYKGLNDDERCQEAIKSAHPDYPIIELLRVMTFTELDEDVQETVRHFSSPPVYLRYYTAFKEVNGAKDTNHYVYGIIKDNGAVIQWGQDNTMG